MPTVPVPTAQIWTDYGYPYIGITGKLAVVPLIYQPSAGGGAIIPSAVSIFPTFAVSGAPVVPIAVQLNRLAGVVFEFANPILPTDTVIMTAVDGWATAQGALVAGGTFTFSNYAGQVSEKCFTLDPSQWQMRLGYGVENNIGANWAKTACNWWLGAITIDAKGYPSQISGSAWFTLDASGNVSNGIDNNGFPAEFAGNGSSTGIWGVKYDDTSPGVTASTKVASWKVTNSDSTITIVQSVVNPGTWDGQAWRGIELSFLITRTGANFGGKPTLLELMTSDHHGYVGIDNFQVIPPGGQPIASVLDLDLVTMERTSQSYCSRHVISGGQNGSVISNMTVPSDLDHRRATDAFWGVDRVTLAVAAVLPVLFPLIVQNDRHGPITLATQPGGWIAIQTATPHGFHTGQLLQQDSWPASAPLPTVGSFTAHPNAMTGNVYVIDDITFALAIYGMPSTIAAPITYAAPLPTVWVWHPQQPGTSYEVLAHRASVLAEQNGEHLLVVPFGIQTTLPTVAAVMTEQVCPYLSPRVKLAIQMGNEQWNFAETNANYTSIIYPYVPNDFTGGTGYNSGTEYSAALNVQAATVARLALIRAGLPGSNVLNVAWSGMDQIGVTQGILSFFTKYKLPLDLIWFAYYSDNPLDAATINRWLSTYPPALARQMLLSYARTAFWFDPQNAAAMAANGAALAAFNVAGNTGMGRPAYYEASPEIFANAATVNAAALAQDCTYDPVGDTELAFLTALQEAGRRYAKTMPHFPEGSDYIESVPFCCCLESLQVPDAGLIYGAYKWRGQVAGPGVANQFSWAPSGPMQAHHDINQSVRGFTHQLWMAAANP